MKPFLKDLYYFNFKFYLRNKSFAKTPGFISGIFLIFYSIFRFIIEFTREPDEQLGNLLFNLTMGQIISLFFILIGFYFSN